MRGTSLLLVLAAVLCSSAAGDTVADSCAAIRDFVDVAFCASRLRSVPGASSADRHAHLLAAAGLAAASGALAWDAAAGLARAEGEPAARDALEACALLYGAGSVPALRLMRGYAAARAWAAARALLLLTGHAGIACDAALAGAPAAGSMAGANREFHQLATMATALLNAVS
jgi:pectinesterase inhibitor-like protein